MDFTTVDNDFKNETLDESEEPLPESKLVKKKSNSKANRKNKRNLQIEELKYKVRLVIEPKSIHIENEECDGPIAQVVFMNHALVRQYRQEIEEFFENLSKRIEDDHRNLRPQNSSLTLFKNDRQKEMAFTAIGNVQYFNRFCIDTIGKPLCNDNPRLTAGWTIPDYEQMYTESLPVDEQPSGNKRQKACCFNCGEDDHAVRDCPQPQDLVRIGINKKKFMSKMSNMSSKRYHVDEDNIEKFKPGHLSETLRNALGLNSNQLPLHIYQMRVYNYPPGHLKAAEIVTSGLTVYDNPEDGESVDSRLKNVHPDYEHDKLICYPGFNVDIPHNVLDECERFRMPPMQPNQRMEKLKRQLPTPTKNKTTSKKRSKNFSDNDSSEELKRRKIDSRQEENMDISITDSDADQKGYSSPCDENFKPPLPPTPGYSTPPPLPTSTPPPTPRRTSTPRSPQVDAPVMSRTPSCGSLDSEANNIGGFSPLSGANSQSSRGQSPSLDELEQQRLNLLSAFDDGDTEGTSDTGEMIKVNGEFFSITDTADISGMEQKDGSSEEKESNADTTVNDDSQTPDSTDQSCAEEGVVQPSNKDPGYSSERTDESDDVVVKESPLRVPKKDDLTPNKSGVPHWSKFSKDISPHPPDENLMESTGVFKRLCGILKRNKKGD
ncbi:zinc finger CCHC domain-containing protein 8-like [Antedon mediterranea]|uniref:zinc finger CCHC domain-containing protein 8-like n=1 Tax=Antedon mediterranea TaxID=105859 RepID=UPI003AF5AC1E